MEETNERKMQHLAYHETMEIHELVAFQAIGLMKLKKSINEVHDKRLRALYEKTIMDLEDNLRDLTAFYGMAPRAESSNPIELTAGFFAGDLLAFAKASVRNYAIAITETATPAVRDTLTKHLQKAITCHSDIFKYMYDHKMYPAYDLHQLLEHDLAMANQALEFGQ